MKASLQVSTYIFNVENNKRRPYVPGFYSVQYSDNTMGIEFFNGNYWECTYKPVAYWFDNTLN